MAKKENIILEKTYRFALDIIQMCTKMREQKEFVLSKQLLRSATSIGANTEEAMAAQSRKDFINKMSIASNEARETHYWLCLFRDSNLCKGIAFSNAIQNCEEIKKILSSIVKTTTEKNSNYKL